MPTKNPRILVTVDDELFQLIEDFRFENRFQSRNAAMLALMRAGFEAVRKEEEAAGQAAEERDEEREVHQPEDPEDHDIVGR